MKYCGNCGSQMQDMDNVCSGCGAPVDRNIRVYHQGEQLEKTANNLALTGMIIGISSLIFFLVPFVPLILAIIGIIISVMGIKEADTGKGRKGMAIAGLVCSIVALLLGGLLTSCYVCYGCAICGSVDKTWL